MKLWLWSKQIVVCSRIFQSQSTHHNQSQLSSTAASTHSNSGKDHTGPSWRHNFGYRARSDLSKFMKQQTWISCVSVFFQRLESQTDSRYSWICSWHGNANTSPRSVLREKDFDVNCKFSSLCFPHMFVYRSPFSFSLSIRRSQKLMWDTSWWLTTKSQIAPKPFRRPSHRDSGKPQWWHKTFLLFFSFCFFTVS